MYSASLIIASTFLLLILGTTHLIFTFVGSKFYPRDISVKDKMDATSPVITSQTTVWRAWLGFNASHSIGVITFSLLYLYLSLIHPDFLFKSYFLIIIGALVIFSYIVLSKLYWFKVPLFTTAFSFFLYCLGAILGLHF